MEVPKVVPAVKLGLIDRLGLPGWGMVQDVERVDTKLHAFRFRDPERLREVRIETPDWESSQNVLAQVSLVSRLRILENDDPIFAAAIIQREGASRA